MFLVLHFLSCECNSAFQSKISFQYRFVPLNVENKRNWVMSGVLAAVIPGLSTVPFRPAYSRTSSLSMHEIISYAKLIERSLQKLL